MSKLAAILQARTLPQQTGLFANCGPAVPDMFRTLSKCWQSSGVQPVVENVDAPCAERFDGKEDATREQSHETRDADILTAQHAHIFPEPVANISPEADAKTYPEPQSNSSANTKCGPLDDCDAPWVTRLASQWQVGIETLVPITWDSELPVRTFQRIADTTCSIRNKAEEGVGDTATSSSTEVERIDEKLSFAPADYLSQKLVEAVQTGTTSTVQQVLQLLNRQPQSAIGALLTLRTTLTKSATTPITVDWETGTDSNGKSFTRIKFTLMNDCSKGAGSTRFVIGSDGTTYATFIERWNSYPMYMSPDEALDKLKGISRLQVRDLQKFTMRFHQETLTKASGF